MSDFVFSFNKYMDDVFSQLECNASDDYKSKYITFTYSQDIIEKLRDTYFRECYDDGLSAYKALTFLSDTKQYKEIALL